MGWVIIIISGDDVEAYDGKVFKDYDKAYRTGKELYFSDIYPEGITIKLLPVKFEGLCDDCPALEILNGIKIILGGIRQCMKYSTPHVIHCPTR